MAKTLWLDTYSGPVWRYRSEYRPITQLPLDRLDVVIDPATIGPDVRDLITARELTANEVSQFQLTINEKASN